MLAPIACSARNAIAVVFVGQLAQAEGGPDIAYLGVAVAAVIGAVSVFLVLAKKAKS